MIAAFDTIGCGVAIYGPAFELLYANGKTEANFPVIMENLRAGMSMRDAVVAQVRAVRSHEPESVIAIHADTCMEKILSGEPVDFPTADNRIIRAYHAPMPDGGHIGISADITELLESRTALREAKRRATAESAAKTRFLATVSHEIRTPLNGVLGTVQALARRPMPDMEREMVETILQSSHALLRILNDGFDLSRLEAGQIEIVPEPCDLRENLRQLERLHRETAVAKGLDFRVVVAPAVPARLLFDPVRVCQCVTNLVSNAIKFTHHGSVNVAVTARRPVAGETEIVIHVHDTGIGMDDHTIGKLFRSFVQADPSIARRYGGTGLGLSITRQLLQRMGGDVSVVSVPGQGSVFSMTFRAATTSAGSAPSSGSLAPDPAARLSPGELRGLQVLLVDDHAVNRKVVCRLLDLHGLEIHEVASGRSAIDALHQAPYDLVLLDINMPGVDGVDTFHEIRGSGQSWAGIPVVALTADAMPEDRNRYLSMGMNGYAAKPIREAELLTAMLQALAAGPSSRRAG